MNQLQLGVGRQKITPKVGCQLYGYNPNVFSESVADDLNATAFVFRQDVVTSLIVSLDICVVNVELSKKIRLLIEKEFNISENHILLSASHTHTGPNVSGSEGWGSLDTEYAENIFIPGILEAVRIAVSNIIPVKVGMAKGKSLTGINRRELWPDNSIHLGQNEWGCFNPQMTVIAFRSMDDKPIANIVHYAAHNTAASGQCLQISRDWAGVMVDRLEEISGGITAFLNGCAGDVGPRLTNGRTSGGMKYVWEIGSVAAQDAVRIYKSISRYTNEMLDVGKFTVKIPYKKRIPYEEAVKGYEQYKNESENLAGKLKRIYADIIKSYDDGLPDKPYREDTQVIIRIGEAAFIGFTYELFSEIGLRIAKISKMPYALCVCYTNGRGTYFASQDQISRGGYEVMHFKFTDIQSPCDDADWHLITETVNNLNKIREE